MNNPMQLIGEFKKFLSGGITPQKAEQIVKEKISNGSITPEQFENLKLQAQQMQGMFNMFM